MQNILLKKQLLTKDETGKSIYDKYCQERFIAIRNYDLNFKVENDNFTNLKIDINDLINTNTDYKIERPVLYEIYKRTKNILSFDINYNEWKCLEQLRNCKKVQRKEIINHLTFWIINDYEIHFSTYTLNDNTLNKYADSNLENSKQLQDKLTRILNQYTEDYIGNVDYGFEHNRLHYHVLEAIKKQTREYTNKNYIRTPINIQWDKYGFSKTEIVCLSEKSLFDVSSYLAKLTNHSIKVKTNRLFIKKNTLWKEYKYIRSYYKDKIDKYSMIKFIANKYNLKKEDKQVLEERYELISLLYQLE